MRIFHGPIPVVGLPWAHSRAQRKLGHVSDFVLFDTFGSEWLLEGWDKNLRLTKQLISVPHFSFRVNNILHHIKFGKFVLDCMKNYDVFHFYSNWSLFPGKWLNLDLFPLYRDLPILRSLGKKIVFHRIGCSDSKLKTNFSKLDPCVCSVCKAGFSGLCNDKKTAFQCFIQKKYGHATITGLPDMSDFDQESIYVPATIDLDRWKFKESRNISAAEPIKVIQVAGNLDSRGDTKGVRYTTQAIKRLKESGCNVDLAIVDRIPIHNMPSVIERADIVVDQLLFGWFGLSAIEAMALGKPVIAYLRESWLQFHCEHFSKPPIVEAHPKDLFTVLRELIRKEDLPRLGLQCRRYVEEVHDPLKIGQKLIEQYSTV